MATYLMKNLDLKIGLVIRRRTTLFSSAYDWYPLPLFLDGCITGSIIDGHIKRLKQKRDENCLPVCGRSAAQQIRSRELSVYDVEHVILS